MLPKRARLTSSGVQRVLKKPFRGKEGLFKYSWKENRVGYPRCAVVVTKGVSINSVQRNRIRRVLYAVLEEVLNGRVFSGDIIIFVRSSGEQVGKDGVLGDLKKIVLNVSEALRKTEEQQKSD